MYLFFLHMLRVLYCSIVVFCPCMYNILIYSVQQVSAKVVYILCNPTTGSLYLSLLVGRKHDHCMAGKEQTIGSK